MTIQKQLDDCRATYNALAAKHTRLQAERKELAEALRALFKECESRFDYVEATEEENAAMAKASALLARLED